MSISSAFYSSSRFLGGELNMKQLKALAVVGCLLLSINCRTANQMQVQEITRTGTALLVAGTEAGAGEPEPVAENVWEQDAEGEMSDLLSSPDRAEPNESAQEMEARDSGAAEVPEPVTSQAVDFESRERETGNSDDTAKDERISGAEQTTETQNTAGMREYYIQVGSWKNLSYAEETFMKVREIYPDARLIRHNNFYKVRIPGVMSKRQGTVIAQNIEKDFNMEPLLVLKMNMVPLDDAVRPFIGTSYRNIDCYGLIVRGLINQGVRYYGRGGLRERLENLALHEGLPDNAYQNGEGLVEKAGTIIFSNSVLSIVNIQQEADRIYSTITPYLRKGIILSFSTTSRGHTGIISRWEDHWTYINSGLIDNQITTGEVSERVGEEFLKAEIENWVNLASSRNEPLTVTLGKIDETKLPESGRSKKTDELAALNMH